MTTYSANTYQRRTPYTIEASQYDGTANFREWIADQDEDIRPHKSKNGPYLAIHHGDGTFTTVRPGDWIINTETGEWETMTNDQFIQQYTPTT